LFPLKVDVKLINDRELAKLEGVAHTFSAVDEGKISETFEKMFPVERALILKVGAQVVFRKNTDDFKNGTRGVVTRILYPGDKEVGGGTAADTEEGEDEEEDVTLIKAPAGVVVQCTNGKFINVFPIKFEINIDGKIVATRTALPLKHGWAITIHGAQGMSIDLLFVDLSFAFGAAQAYVALSRATSAEGLRVVGLKPHVVFCSDKVKRYYKKLEDEVDAAR